MIKLQVIGDPKNPKGFSSNIIIESLNAALKKVGLYDEAGKKVAYSCICSDHGQKADAFICSYEIPFSQIIYAQSRNRPILGVNLDNLRFIIDGDINPNLVGFFPLGVDNFKYPVVQKKTMMDSFVFLAYTESLIRSGYHVLVPAFGRAFSGSKDDVLYIKNRNGTDAFKLRIENQARYYNIQVKYENNHLGIEEELEVYRAANAAVYVNMSSTWAMPCLQLMTCGVPSIIMPYSGPAEYTRDEWNALAVKYDIEYLDDRVLRPLMEIGMRNFFFADGYAKQPYWARPNIDSLAMQMLRLRKDPELGKRLATNGRITGEQFTWEKSAMALSAALREFGF